jgi:hypothetical protein
MYGPIDYDPELLVKVQQEHKNARFGGKNTKTSSSSSSSSSSSASSSKAPSNETASSSSSTSHTRQHPYMKNVEPMSYEAQLKNALGLSDDVLEDDDDDDNGGDGYVSSRAEHESLNDDTGPTPKKYRRHLRTEVKGTDNHLSLFLCLYVLLRLFSHNVMSLVLTQSMFIPFVFLFFLLWILIHNVIQLYRAPI